MKVGYCMWCGMEVTPQEIEASTGNVFWCCCSTPQCRGNKIRLKTDAEGFVLDPINLLGHYIYSRPDKTKHKR
jgi:hypothetical protein